MGRSSVRVFGGLCVAAALAACGGSGSGSSPTTPTNPSTPAINEKFTGTLETGLVIDKTFQGGVGEFAVVLVTLTPSLPGGIGIGFGSWDGSKCTLGAVNANTTAGGGLHGTITAAGTKCLKIYDSGGIPPGFTSDFAILVSHY